MVDIMSDFHHFLFLYLSNRKEDLPIKGHVYHTYDKTNQKQKNKSMFLDYAFDSDLVSKLSECTTYNGSALVIYAELQYCKCR